MQPGKRWAETPSEEKASHGARCFYPFKNRRKTADFRHCGSQYCIFIIKNAVFILFLEK